VVHAGDESVGVCFVGEGVFNSLEVVVIDKACHANADAVKTICQEVGGAVTETVLQVEVSTAGESPCAVRGCAALTSAIDPKVGTVGVVTSGNSKKSLDVVDGVFEHVALDACDFVGNAEGATDDSTEGLNDSIEAGGCMVAEFQVGEAGEEAVFGLEHFQSDGVKGGATRTGSIVAFVENM
jgi:hypothetical protein